MTTSNVDLSDEIENNLTAILEQTAEDSLVHMMKLENYKSSIETISLNNEKSISNKPLIVNSAFQTRKKGIKMDPK